MLYLYIGFKIINIINSMRKIYNKASEGKFFIN